MSSSFNKHPFWQRKPQLLALLLSLLLHLIVFLPWLLRSPQSSNSAQASQNSLSQNFLPQKPLGQSLRILSLTKPELPPSSFPQDPFAQNPLPETSSPPLEPSWVRPQAPTFSLPELTPAPLATLDPPQLTFRFPQLDPENFSQSSTPSPLLPPPPRARGQTELPPRTQAQAPLQLSWTSNSTGWQWPQTMANWNWPQQNSPGLAEQLPTLNKLGAQMPLRIALLINEQGQVQSSVLPTQLERKERLALAKWLQGIQLEPEANSTTPAQRQSGILSLSH